MMSPVTEPLTEFERNARRVLEESLARIDARTRSRLNQARHAALEAAQPRPRRPLWRSFTFMPAAGAAAAALLVAVMLWHREPSGTEPPLFEGRTPALSAEDVFHGKQGWEEALARLVLDQAAEEAKTGAYELPFSEPSELSSEVSDPAHWLITDRALAIRFEIDAFPHVIAAEIPWREIKAYLRSPLPFAISSN